MRIMRSGPVVAFGLLFLAIPIQAQQTSTPAPRDASAVSLLQRSLAALVGTNTVKDVTLSGSANYIAGSDNETGSATLKATAVGQGRVDLSLSNGPRSEVVDASQAASTGSWSGPDGAWHQMVAHNLMTDPTWFFPAFLLSRLLSTSTYAVSPVDSEAMDGVAVQHLTVYQHAAQVDPNATLMQSLSRMDVYLDPSTLLPAAIAFNIHPDNNALVNIPVEIKFSNYQSTQGILVPNHIQKYIQNTLALDVTVSGAQFNTGLSGSDFQAQ